MRGRYGVPRPVSPEMLEQRQHAQDAEQAILSPIVGPASLIRGVLYPKMTEDNFVRANTIPNFLAGVGYGLVAGFALGMLVGRKS